MCFLGHADHAHDDGHPISLTDSLYGGLKNNLLASSSEILGSSGEKGILKRVKRGYSSHEDTRVPYNSNAKSRYVELVIVVDNKKYKELGGDLKAVRRRTKDIASIVNSVRINKVLKMRFTDSKEVWKSKIIIFSCQIFSFMLL